MRNPLYSWLPRGADSNHPRRRKHVSASSGSSPAFSLRLPERFTTVPDRIYRVTQETRDSQPPDYSGLAERSLGENRETGEGDDILKILTR